MREELKSNIGIASILIYIILLFLPLSSMAALENDKVEPNRFNSLLDELEEATIMFVVPNVINQKTSSQIILALSFCNNKEKLETSIKQEMQENSIKTEDFEFYKADKIKVGDLLKARLTSHNFDITPITSEKQSVLSKQNLTWKWEIHPKEVGVHSLHLALTALWEIDAKIIPSTIKIYDHKIKVTNISTFSLTIFKQIYIGILFIFISFYLFLIWSKKWAIFLQRTISLPFNRTISQYFATSDTLIIISIFFILASLIISHEVWQIYNERNLSVTIFGGGIAIASYFLNAGIKLHSEMRDHALVLMRDPSTNEKLREDMQYVGRKFLKLRASGKELPIGGINIFNKKLFKKLKSVAGFYEEIAICIRSREAMESLLKDYYLVPFLNFYESGGKQYIEYVRKLNKENLASNEIYCNIEYLYDSWRWYSRKDLEIDKDTPSGQDNIFQEFAVSVVNLIPYRLPVSISNIFDKYYSNNSKDDTKPKLIKKITRFNQILHTCLLIFFFCSIVWFFGTHSLINR